MMHKNSLGSLCQNAARKVLRRIFHSLPVTSNAKMKLKGLCYALFGSTLMGSKTFNSWRIEQRDQKLLKVLKKTFPDLPKADGKWEWSDYHTLRSLFQAKGIEIPSQTDHNDVRLIAFYLPQYHPIPENDVWWGKGFTEWTNVAKAKPNFIGHDQPRYPADLGYYDLRLPEVMQEQVKLAKQYGIDGFCFYYYWFNGRRLLEGPLNALVKDESLQMPFCLCWANGNWTRTWDGLEKDVLMEQCHSDDDDMNIIQDLVTYFKNPNYIRINGKPLLIVYKIDLFQDFSKTAQSWRDFCRKEGVGEIYLSFVEFGEQYLPSKYGCDAAIEFPPHANKIESNVPSGKVINPEFKGEVYNYRDVAAYFTLKADEGRLLIPGVMTSWDNTARRQNNPHCFEQSTPGAFQAWLEAAIHKTEMQAKGDERLVFINAWNEWAEGAYLEPDKRFGHAYLEAVKRAKYPS